MGKSLKAVLRWKKRIPPLAALAVIGAAGASYAYNEASIQVSGTVNYGCTVSSQFTNGSYTVPDLVAADGSIKSYSVQFDLGPASCNYSSTLTLSSDNGKLKRVGDAATIPGGFADNVPYSASLLWGSDSSGPMVNTGTQFVAIIPGNAAKNDGVKVNLSIPPSSTKLIEGYYTDLLKIRLQSVL